MHNVKPSKAKGPKSPQPKVAIPTPKPHAAASLLSIPPSRFSIWFNSNFFIIFKNLVKQYFNNAKLKITTFANNYKTNKNH